MSLFRFIFVDAMEEYKEYNICYGYDFQEINAPQLNDYCIHMACTEGEGSFVLDGHSFRIGKGDLVVSTRTDLISNMVSTDSTIKVEFLAAPNKMLYNLLPANNFGIGGAIQLFQNPVLKTTEEEARLFLEDIRHIRSRLLTGAHAFQKEAIESMLLTMMYDLFGIHARNNAQVISTDRTSAVIKGFLALLESGASQSHRDVKFYADHLNVSVKYLENTVRRLTGASVTSYIDRYTIPMIIAMLKDNKYSFTQIADRMNFASLSYFSRYVTKHLGMSPTQYRQTLSPKIK